MSFIEQIMLLFKQQKQACCIALAGLVLSLEKSACLCLQQQGLKVCSITPSLPPPQKNWEYEKNPLSRLQSANSDKPPSAKPSDCVCSC